MTTLTVLMPVYNAMPYVPSAVGSILDQSFPDFEFLILDNGSTDGSGKYLQSLADPRVRLFHTEHQGLASARNFLIERARTEFFALMDADDLAHPDRLRTQIGFIHTHAGYCSVGHANRFPSE